MEEYDVVVLGSGAAGLTAAISAYEHGARVAVFEKAGRVGGTSAWSGGMLWIPTTRTCARRASTTAPTMRCGTWNRCPWD